MAKVRLKGAWCLRVERVSQGTSGWTAQMQPTRTGKPAPCHRRGAPKTLPVARGEGSPASATNLRSAQMVCRCKTDHRCLDCFPQWPASGTSKSTTCPSPRLIRLRLWPCAGRRLSWTQRNYSLYKATAVTRRHCSSGKAAGDCWLTTFLPRRPAGPSSHHNCPSPVPSRPFAHMLSSGPPVPTTSPES